MTISLWSILKSLLQVHHARARLFANSVIACQLCERKPDNDDLCQ
jgi:hypothetical protein